MHCQALLVLRAFPLAPFPSLWCCKTFPSKTVKVPSVTTEHRLDTLEEPLQTVGIRFILYSKMTDVLGFVEIWGVEIWGCGGVGVWQ